MKMMTTKPPRARIREHANSNINRILDILGITYVRRGDLVQACCPCKQHPGDGNNPTAFSWRDSAGHWVCLTHHCEQEFGGDKLHARSLHEYNKLSWNRAADSLVEMYNQHKFSAEVYA